MSLLWHRGWVGKEKVDMPTNKQTPDLVCGANCRERKDESCVESRPNNFMNEERTKIKIRKIPNKRGRKLLLYRIFRSLRTIHAAPFLIIKATTTNPNLFSCPTQPSPQNWCLI